MKKLLKLLACVLVVLLAIVPVCAQEQPDPSAAQPLVDLTAAAAVSAGEIPASLSVGGSLNAEFVYQLFLLGPSYEGLGLTDACWNDTAAQEAWLKKAFAAQPPVCSGILSLGEEHLYIGMQVMTADVSPDGKNVRIIGNLYEADNRIDLLTDEQLAGVRWLDRRAVVSLTADSDMSCGWHVTAFSAADDLSMEELMGNYVNTTMMEYVAGDGGFSIQYPAVFAEDMLQDEEFGISGKLTDGSASFYARRVPNAEHKTAEQIAAEADDADVTVNEATGCVKIMRHDTASGTSMDLYLVGEDWIYTANLTYANQLAADFAPMCEFMTNSFNADELGVG